MIVLLNIFFLLFSIKQEKEKLDVCLFLHKKASVVSFNIPDTKATKSDKIIGNLEQDIKKNFEFNAQVIHINEYNLRGIGFAEVFFVNNTCDTASIFFIRYNKTNLIIHSDSYKTDNNDLRVLSKKNTINIYRKIKFRNKNVTVNFNFDVKNCQLNSFIDDGLSIWESN
ncbi:MAG: hypothetical protein J7604_22760 [Sporocytophaga sp.]|uniref:hypothetical protein n=1 Tax=Sporocytophaga sp. TaxID=2231183 RepID=UPI001B22997E|nr:hypothetical protein [Sporocytophaga sp.]MBO9703054.1 hypothetical protein [Sporocytophaga sp.]